jgi:hypothetical protein
VRLRVRRKERIEDVWEKERRAWRMCGDSGDDVGILLCDAVVWPGVGK